MSFMVIIWTDPPHVVFDSEREGELWVADSWDEAAEFCTTNRMAEALGASIIDIEAREMAEDP